ncbi:MAG: peptide chain release factor N(5)-glutamine methyltransferase [Candidatus Acetothermia bacterium]|jgi:release factor glutamine methyltransferase|nr:peptide chain release factor N(5)-glutamine methyltransferase [Candidatus Acetothermia bacterium]MDH7504995.1 peptide chain release factor N(5)-glutamine methyltransferase [Candidatus Acetothermia bacterium]
MEGEWTVRRVLGWTGDYLRRGGVERACFEAEELLAHVLGVERLMLYLQPERALTAEERARYRELIRQRHAGVPLQYLLGEVEFMGLPLRVDGRALIPRPETEQLVELILRDLGSLAEAGLKLLELGTGSGAIAIALAHSLPRGEITAADISTPALALARENAARNGVASRIALIQSDWFAAVEGRFDLIVANPPYVSRDEARSLPREVREHEPRSAWDGGEEGLEALRRIVTEAPPYLKAGGGLYLEIGASQGARVRSLALASGAYERMEVLPDLSGRERFFRAVRRAR